jgi:putative peptidoglycan lipid II flippase
VTAPTADGEAQGADIVGRHRRLAARTLLISVFTAASRVCGYVREVLSAVIFGDASPVYDAFVTAWRVPNLFRRLMGEGAVATALQTSLTEVDCDRGESAGRQLFWSTLRVSSAIAIGIAAVVMGLAALMGDTMPLTGWHWLGEDPAAVRELTVRLTPFVVVICLAGLASGGLAVRGRFGGSNLGPVAMNACLIATLVGIGLVHGWSGLDPADGPAGRERHLDMARFLAWGTLVAGSIQLLVLWPDLRKAGLLGPGAPRGEPRRGRAELSGWSVLRASAPLAVGAAVYQINIMVDGFMAQGMLSRGGPTTYYYANRIQQLPLALIATAATNAVFPMLKALGHQGRNAELRALHDRAQSMVAFLALPASAGLLVLAEPVADGLLGHGEFGAEGVQRTARAIQMLALALLPAGAAGLVIRAYYAIGDLTTPVRVAAAMLVANVVLNALFLAVAGMDVEGLALSTALTSWGNLVLLLPGLWRRLPAAGDRPGSGGAAKDLARIFAATLVLAGAASALVGPALATFDKVWGLLIVITVSIIVYAVASELLRVPQWTALKARFGAFRRSIDRRP